MFVTGAMTLQLLTQARIELFYEEVKESFRGC